MKMIAILLSMFLAAPVGAQGLLLPAGYQVDLIEVIIEPQPYSEEIWMILQVVAPRLAQDVDPAAAQLDMELLCNLWGAPRVAEADTEIDQIVVHLMDHLVTRGEQNSAATQYFASFSLQDTICIWEDF
ncbi:MAG: hypothetical protein ACI8TF_000645 [Paracoccaceae bacterium]|jgi:hypothetical protein